MIDFSRHYTGIVIGVACAAIFAILSIITFSHTRRRLQERRNGSLTQSGRRQVSFSDNDIFQQNAPPTYDDGKPSLFFLRQVASDYCGRSCLTFRSAFSFSLFFFPGDGELWGGGGGGAADGV